MEFESTIPNRKYLLKDNMKEKVSSIFYYGGSDDKLLSNLGIFFDTPKPVALTQEYLEVFTKEKDIILDFFSGSATTAQAVMSLNAGDKFNDKGTGNRKYILINK